MNILVVDDDAPSRYLASMILRSGGHEVETASDGIEALEKARERCPDLVISDILMPRMDGYRLVMEWKSDPRLADALFVFYTASYTDPADERFALELGADLFLVKPIDPDHLLEELETLDGSPPRDVSEVPGEPEAAVLREYSERLVHKLESKVLELQRANAMLSGALEALTDEVEVKRALVQELSARVEEVTQLGEEAHVLAAAVHASSIATVILKIDGETVFTNSAYESLMGICSAEDDDPEYGDVRALTDLVEPEIIEQAKRGITYRGEGNLQCADEPDVAFDLSVSPVFDEEGDVRHIVVEAFAVTRQGAATP